MIKVPANLSELSPEERIKVLRELEEERKQALQKLEEQTREEIEQAEDLIKQSIDDLTEEEEQAFREIERERSRRTAPEPSLEATVEETPAPAIPHHVDYGNPLEEIRRESDVYAITDYHVVGEVERLEKKRLHEGLSDHEQDLLDRVKYQVDKFGDGDRRLANDTYQNLRRLKTALDNINEAQRDLYNR